MLFESFLWLLKHRPWILLFTPLWLLRGRATLKYEIASRARPNIENLPLNSEFMEFLTQQSGSGREIILISASDERVTRSVADHLGLFTQAFGSDAANNLKAEKKLRRIQSLCGETSFAYAGDSAADLVVWQNAAQIISVNASSDVRRKIDSLQRLSQPESREEGLTLRRAAAVLRPAALYAAASVVEERASVLAAASLPPRAGNRPALCCVYRLCCV